MLGRKRHYRNKRTTKAGGSPPLEKAVERKIINAAIDLGFEVTKFSQPRNTMQTEGIPDLYMRHRAKQYRCWVEVKRPDTGVVSSAQAAWILWERECGGIAFVADSVERFIHQLREHGFPVTIGAT